jgi:hypothetical protein
MKGRILGFAKAALVASALALVLAPAAGAKTVRSAYHVNGTWATSVKHSGLCLQLLTCPPVTNTQGPFLRTHVGSLTGVGASSSGSFVSGSFRYRGAAGRRTGNLVLSLGRHTDTGSLLSVAGNSANYSVAIVGAKTDDAVAQPINNAPLTPTAAWTRVSKRVVPATALQIGHRYRIAITSTFKNGVDVIPGANADYRKVKLVARKHVRKHHRKHHRRHHRHHRRHHHRAG